MRAHQVRSYVRLVSTNDHLDEPRAGGTAARDALVAHYEIRVRGHLGTRWAAWFDGMTLTEEGDGTTVICGPVVDQAALHGLLEKLRDLGIPLLSLTGASPRPPDATPTGQRTSTTTHTRHHPPGAPS